MVYLKLSNQGDFTEDSVYITITSIKYKVISRVTRINARNKIQFDKFFDIIDICIIKRRNKI